MKILLMLLASLLTTNQGSAAYAAECSGAKTQLFGVNLKCATRIELDYAFKRNETSKHKMTSSRYKDKYHRTKDLIDKTHNLTLYYTTLGKFAEATYAFYTLGRRGLDDVVGMVSSKYGEPKQVDSSSSFSNYNDYQWKQPDGIVILVHERGNGIDLTYTHPKNKRMMEREKKAFEEAEKKDLFHKQSGNF